MAMWKKALVVGLAVILGVFPVLARVEPGLQVATTAVQQTSVPLPRGDEMGDDELLQAEGEFWWFIVPVLLGAAAGAGAAAIHEAWFDEDPGIDADDRGEIIFGAISGAIGGIAGAVGARLVAYLER